MNDFSDERIRFYLRHRSQIEEWAAIRRDAVNATKAFLCTLSADFDELSSEFSQAIEEPDVEAKVFDRGENGNFILVRKTSWPLNDKGRPLVGVGIGWSGSVLLGEGHPPWVGVRVSKTHDRWKELSKAIRDLGIAGGCRKSDDPSWPIYDYVDACAQYWEDERLEAHRDTLRRAVESRWEQCEAWIDRASATWAQISAE